MLGTKKTAIKETIATAPPAEEQPLSVAGALAILRDEERHVEERLQFYTSLVQRKKTMQARLAELFTQKHEAATSRSRESHRAAEVEEQRLLPEWFVLVDLLGDETAGVGEADAPAYTAMLDLKARQAHTNQDGAVAEAHVLREKIWKQLELVYLSLIELKKVERALGLEALPIRGDDYFAQLRGSIQSAREIYERTERQAGRRVTPRIFGS